MILPQTVIKRTLMIRCWTVVTAAAVFLCVQPNDSKEVVPKTILSLMIHHMNDTFIRSDTKLQEKDETPKDRYKDLCLTPACVSAASKLLKGMNPSAKPCDDFYEFVCGNFIKKTVIPDDELGVSHFSRITDVVKKQLRTIIEEPSTENEARPIRMAKELYKSCMNTTKIEEVGLTYAKEIIKRLGGWPVLDGDSWDSSGFTWENMTYRFKDEGLSIDSLISFSVTADFKNSTRNIIYLEKPIKLIQLTKDEKSLAAAYEYMVEIATLFGADRERAKTELKESQVFETGLANISIQSFDGFDENNYYNHMTIPELQEKFPSIKWYEYISNILPKAVQVQRDELVIVAPSYFSGLETLLSTTDKRVQANYFVWQAVFTLIESLPDDLSKKQNFGPRWKECLVNSLMGIPFAVDSLYVQRFFNEEAKKNAIEMVGNIREEMYSMIEYADWMDDTTRKNALEKAKYITSYIAYPDELLDVNTLEEIYEKLEVTNGYYLEGYLNISKFFVDEHFKKLRKLVNKTDWTSFVNTTDVNAFYNLEENSIRIPAGILQDAFYSYDRPNYLNYGGIGYVIGHEITHGFDNQGSLYDKNGNVFDWWDAKTKETFLKRTSCIIQQYGNYTAKQVDRHLNGVLTQGENIADNGGIKQAYKAYNRWVKNHGTEKRLPGLQDFTPQQMFWISAANIWCAKYRPVYLEHLIDTDEHSPGEFRILGAFSNRPEFAEDFKCPLGSPMNPVKKCEVW